MAVKSLTRPPKLTRYTPPSIAFKPWKPPRPMAAGQGFLSKGQRAGLAKLKPGQLGQSIMGDINQWAQNADTSQFGFGGTLTDPSQAAQKYRDLIGGDWGVQGMESEMNARLGRARGDFQSNLRQALVDLGVTDPSKLGNLGSYIDADTIKRAAENKYSQTSRIAQAELQKKSQSEAALAARGGLSSGQATRERTGILAEGENQRYDALRNFLSAGQQGLSGIADLQDELAGRLGQARFDAAGRAAETYGNFGTDPDELMRWAAAQRTTVAPKVVKTPKKVVKKPKRPVFNRPLYESGRGNKR